MLTPDNPFYAQVRLLVGVLPFVARERCFALKGGTAINLFVRDLPRLSVDIDLAFVPIGSREAAFAEIDAALRRIGASAEAEFGFAEIQVLSFEDLYAGKIVAALDRQHPRDLFDVKLLLEAEGISDNLFRAFLVYLVSHDGSIARVINPAAKSLRELFERQFAQMTAAPVTLEALEQTRTNLIEALHAKLDDDAKAFLLSFKGGEPQWDLLGVKHAPQLPAVRWKLTNLERMRPDQRQKEIENLERVLEAI